MKLRCISRKIDFVKLAESVKLSNNNADNDEKQLLTVQEFKQPLQILFGGKYSRLAFFVVTKKHSHSDNNTKGRVIISSFI